MIGLAVLVSTFALVFGDRCTDYVLPSGTHQGAHGIGCVNKGCCQYELQVDNLCDGAQVCCFSSNSCSAGTTSGCPHIISRAEWGARAPTSVTNMQDLPIYMFIHHGSSEPCYDQASCMATVRGYQNYHMNEHGWADIGYNFVVGEDGNAYMGRGWKAVGAHTYGYNSVGVAICVIGDFNSRLPNEKALNTVRQLIQCGLSEGHISPSYTLKGHRDVGETDCPGDQLYQYIHSWPHYAPGTQHYG